jgi:uncharacterized paraquat-inducible protein A
MALTSCPECSRQISNRAPACPHCGVRFKQPSKSSPFRWIVVILLAGILLALGFFIMVIDILFSAAEATYK